MTQIVGAILFSLLPFGAYTQSRAFEVASVKAHEAQGGRISISTSGLRLNAEAKTVASLIMYAYNLKSYQVPYTPSLLPFGEIFYDTAAKAEGDVEPSRDEFRQMLGMLLTERFKLKIHNEMREVPVYALVVGRDGPKLKSSPPGTEPAARYTAIGRNYELTIPNATMDDMVRAVENSFVDRPVLDGTRLVGKHEIKMTYTPDTPSNRRSADPDDISIFAAVQKLGLRLEATKARMEVLIVDHVEKPSEN